MMCKTGNICTSTDGSATNTAACICGSVECASGSTCKSDESFCELMNPITKIIEIEKNQNQCCAKNSAQEKEIEALKKVTELLIKQYEGIDAVCKTDKEGRRLSTGCGHTSTSNAIDGGTNDMSPGAIAAIVVVPLVLIMCCAGGAYFALLKKQKDDEKPGVAGGVELFDVHGSMNSANPLDNANTCTSSPELDTNPTNHHVRMSSNNPMRATEKETETAAVTVTEELPANWQEISGSNGNSSYYWNTVTDATQYERPE